MRKLGSKAWTILVRRLRLDVVEDLLGRLSSRLILWLALGSLTAIFAIFAINLIASRRDVADAARLDTGNLAVAVSIQIGRDVELLDLSLQDLRDGAQNAALPSLPRDLRDLLLFDRAATAHGLGALLLLDASGRIVEQAGRPVPMPLELGAERFFRVHVERPDVGLFVSRPFVSLIDGEPCIALSRRVMREGQFAGVAVATIKTSYFQELFASLELGPRGTVTLLDRDGAMIARQPFINLVSDHVFAPPAFVRRFAGARTGAMEDVSTIDGTRRLFAHAQVGNVPLVVVVGRSVEDIYAPWWRRTAWTGVGLLLLGNLMLVLIAALQIALHHRAAAEAGLAALARTDTLTGLANRRKFDESLEVEWRRAARNRRPLALLLLDIDHFKDFNDQFGHQGGDAVLGAMGRCLAAVPRRPADLVARYGGEEFALLLPETEATDALRIARQVEAAVRGLHQPHPGSSQSILTVSIGATAMLPGPHNSPADLVRAADTGLYEAKRAGRNRTMMHGERLAA